MSLTKNATAQSPIAETTACILIAPQQYPSLAREKQLADEFGLDFVVAEDAGSFHNAIPDAAIVLVTPYARVKAEDFAAMKRCVAVVRYGIGYDNIDVEAARHEGVPVAIVPGAATEEVASHALSMGLALARRIPAGHKAVDDGGWTGKVGLDAPRFSAMNVGVVGMGRIGRQVAAWYAALGCNVRAYDPFTPFDDVPAAEFIELVEQSDVVSLHLPLSARTQNMFSAAVIAKMRKGAVIVNVSRGGLIDEDALAAALASGQLAGAGLDTFTTEPLPAGHVLRTAPNVLLTPHTAWRSDRAMDTLQEAAVMRARQALAGEPISDLITS
jgi:D-3-phosphoglycerate dehydrogenase